MVIALSLVLFLFQLLYTVRTWAICPLVCEKNEKSYAYKIKTETLVHSERGCNLFVGNLKQASD